jgi:LPXTG-site transpeptidase (sortase) family protein
MRAHDKAQSGDRRAYHPAVPGWRAFRVTGPLLLAVVGITSTLLGAGPASGEGLAATTASASLTSGQHPLARGPAPTRLRIPAIGVNSPMMPLGLSYDGSLQVPPDRFTSGWFTGGPRPGQLGPAVIAAHVHWNGQWGAFQHLADLNYGDKIKVDRRDGSTVVFSVTRVSRFKKTQFPTSLVYGNIDHVGLRLITCDGFSATQHAYLDNVVVFAMLVGLDGSKSVAIDR